MKVIFLKSNSFSKSFRALGDKKNINIEYWSITKLDFKRISYKYLNTLFASHNQGIRLEI